MLDDKGNEMRKLLLVIFAYCGMQVTQAASFDCAKARSASEKLICSNADLSLKDDILGTLYIKAKVAAADKHAFRDEQRIAWTWREKNCRNISCVSAWYDERLKELQHVVDTGQLEGFKIPATEDHHALNEKEMQTTKPPSLDRRIAEIKAGLREIQTVAEATVVYGASNGDRIIVQPLIHPDNRNYVIDGFVDPAGGLKDDHLILRIPHVGIPFYAYVDLTAKGATLPSNMRFGSRIAVVGAYIGNDSYTTIAGMQKVMPVIEGLYIQVLN